MVNIWWIHNNVSLKYKQKKKKTDGNNLSSNYFPDNLQHKQIYCTILYFHYFLPVGFTSRIHTMILNLWCYSMVKTNEWYTPYGFPSYIWWNCITWSRWFHVLTSPLDFNSMLPIWWMRASASHHKPLQWCCFNPMVPHHFTSSSYAWDCITWCNSIIYMMELHHVIQSHA